MRIRKNKKLTASIIWSTAASSSSPKPPDELLQSHVCLLNRSPWDASPSPPLSPLHHQVVERDNDNSLACDDSLPPDYSIDDSMKISDDDEDCKPAPSTIIPNSIESDKEKATAAALMAPPVKRRPGRPRKVAVEQPPPAVANNNPYEFYYYSGFGPSWGKKRGNGDNDNEKKKKNIKRRANKGGGTSCSSSSCSRKVGESNEGLDFIYDDDDDEDEEEDNGGRKRMRKPVKARSLKSLIM